MLGSEVCMGLLTVLAHSYDRINKTGAVLLFGYSFFYRHFLYIPLQDLSIILSTITTSLVIAFALHKIMHGPAIAATAPVIDADDEEMTHAVISVLSFQRMHHIYHKFMAWHRYAHFCGSAYHRTADGVHLCPAAVP